MTDVKKHFILIGHPVGHSVSPAIHQAVYDEQGMPHQYTVVDCPDEAAVAAQIERLRRGEIHGANVTVPWKQLAMKLADTVHQSAQVTGAANVLLLNQGRVEAHNTDAPALGRLLAAGMSAAGQTGARTALILGTGGAALGAVYGCQLCGIEQVLVSGRRWLKESSNWPKASQFEGMGAKPVAWSSGSDPGGVGELALRSGVIVQASSAGMLGVGEGDTVAGLIDWERLRKDCFVYDVVYNPPVTPFLDAARRSGIAAEGGLSMLVGQAALAIELWLGISPNTDTMMAAAKHAIFGYAAEEDC